MDEDHKLDHLKDGFTQFVADNVDHDIDIQDGKGTFHEMGIIACSILNKDIPEKTNEANTTNFKKDAMERKDSIKHNWYQQKDVRSFSKIILSQLKDIKEKIAA